MVKQAQKSYGHKELEISIRQRWKETDAYNKTKAMREQKGLDYYFIDGPPYTTGNIHIGIALNKSLKDAYIRYLRMRGYNVRGQPGFDMHGLPIEVLVERSMRIKDKREIEKLGIDKFVTACRNYALDFQRKMTEQFIELGVWMDWDNPYLTIKNEYIDAAWWTIAKAHEKGLLTEDDAVLPWCPRCQTVLAESEIEYWDESDPSIYVMFPVLGEKETYLLIWTTTPWTLPANIAIAAHPDFNYARVLVSKGERDFTIIALQERISDLMAFIQPETYNVQSVFSGKTLEGIQYKSPLYEDVELQRTITGDWVHRVVLSKIVTAENSGLVHIAPGHGREDFETGKEYGLPVVCPVDELGVFTDEAGNFKGMSIKEANQIITFALKNKNMLFHSDKIVHRYGHCWRCKNSIIYRPTRQWFLKVSLLKERMIEELQNVKWTPEWVGSGRMREWVENARDWCISRQRYWGIPIPVWRCSCGSMKVISTSAQLNGAEGFTPGMDLHRPWIDAVKLKCEVCGGSMLRVTDVLDVWFDSGVCSWAQLNYPSDENEFKRWFPCKWITEAYEQTRGWFYSQLGAGVITMDRCPYQSVLAHGLIIDDKGHKMSKSSGNATTPKEMIDKYGADSLRFYLLKSGPVWDDLLFSKEGVRNTNRTLNVLWNVYVFSTTYMALDNYNPKKYTYQELLPTMKPEDKWMISVTESMKKRVTAYMDEYNIHKVCRELEHYILEDLSRWYVKLVRDRVWIEGENKDKYAVYYTLHQSLVTIAQLMAPITPHIAEEIYGNIEGWQPTVNMCEWPEANEQAIDPQLEKNMEIVRTAIEAASRARQEAGTKLRWPLKRAIVVSTDEKVAKALEAMKTLFLSQANVKSLKIFLPGEEWEELDMEVLPNPDAIGNQYRQWATKIAAMLRMQNPRDVKAGIEKGNFSLGIEGQVIRIFPNMVKFSYKPPSTMKASEFEGGKIYIDLEMSPELKSEAFARELIRRIQDMRKELALNVEEYIESTVVCEETLKKMLSTRVDMICKETRSHKLQFRDVPVGECIIEWGIGEFSVIIGVTPLRVAEKTEILLSLGIPGMERDKAKALVFAGYTSADKLKYASPEELIKVRGISRELAEAIHSHLKNPPKTVPVSGIPGMVVGPHPPQQSDIPPPPDDEQNYPSVAPTQPAPAHVPVKLARQKTLELKNSYIYMIKDVNSDDAYKFFTDGLQKGAAGFCITRSFPDRIREKYNVKDVPVIWLTNAPKENAMRPKDLEKLSLAIDHFLKSKGEGSIIMLDCIEYLVTNNNFSIVLRFLQSLRDMVAINKAVLIITANPATFEPQQFNLIESEVDVSI